MLRSVLGITSDAEGPTLMFHDSAIAGSWPVLVSRLDEDGALDRWTDREPALAGIGGIAGLVGLLAEGGDRARADALVGALVRLAAADGGDEPDATVLLLHLLSPMVFALAAQLADLTPDIVAIIAGQLTCQIRAYPWRNRSRAWAANLRADTRAAVLAEFRPRIRRHPACVEVLTGDIERSRVATQRGDEEDLDVVDLLIWAVHAGVDRADVALLIATECGRDRYPRGADRRVAAEQGVALRSLYRRRERTLTALRTLAPRYLADVA